MGWLLKLQEMATKRQKVKDTIDDHVQQIVEDWIMLEAVKHSQDIPIQSSRQWVTDLCDCLECGIRKIRSVGYNQSAISKLVDEVLLSDAKLFSYDIVINMVAHRMKIEKVPTDTVDSLVLKWLEIGIKEISSVLKHDISVVYYEERKNAELDAIRV